MLDCSFVLNDVMENFGDDLLYKKSPRGEDQKPKSISTHPIPRYAHSMRIPCLNPIPISNSPPFPSHINTNTTQCIFIQSNPTAMHVRCPIYPYLYQFCTRLIQNDSRQTERQYTAPCPPNQSSARTKPLEPNPAQKQPKHHFRWSSPSCAHHASLCMLHARAILVPLEFWSRK